MNALVMKLAQLKTGLDENKALINVAMLATTAGVATVLVGVNHIIEGNTIIPECMCDAVDAFVEEAVE